MVMSVVRIYICVIMSMRMDIIDMTGSSGVGYGDVVEEMGAISVPILKHE